MPSSPLSATAEEDKTSPDDAWALELSVLKDPLSEEKASREMTPHPEEMPSLNEKPLKEGEPLAGAKLSSAAVKELSEGGALAPSVALVMMKELPERPTPSVAVVMVNELPEGITPSVVVVMVKELPVGINPSAAVAKELPEGVMPSAVVMKELPVGINPSAAVAMELPEGVTPSVAVAKELPEGVTPSAAVAKGLPELDGVTPSAEERSAEETKLSKTKTSCANSPARIGRPAYFLGVPYPKGAVRFMVLVSVLYALITPRLLRRVSGETTAFVWIFSHIVTSYFFIGTICLSKIPFYTIFFRISYGELLSVAAIHFIGTESGATIATLLTFCAAGMFGHGIAEYLQREEMVESINQIVTTPSSQVKQYGESFYQFLFTHGILSCLVALRMVSLVVYPESVLLPIGAKNHVYIPLFIVEELALEIIFLAWPWSSFIGVVLQEELAVSLSTMLYKIPTCVIVFYLLSSVLSCTVGKVAAMLTVWLVGMTMAGLFGYIFAMFARYKVILKSLSQEEHYNQNSMVQKVPAEPNQKVEEPNL